MQSLRRRISGAIFALLFCLCLFLLWPDRAAVAAPFAQTAAPVTWLGSVGGALQTVAVSGTIAYIGEGAALAVLDVSQPQQPVRIGRLPLPDLVYDIQIVDTLLYVATGYSGVQIIDSAIPQTPHILATYDTAGVALRTYVSAERLYIADGSAGIVILAVDALPQIKPLSTLPLGEAISGVQMVKGLLYAWDINLGLFIVDIAEPTKPIARKNIEMHLWDVDVSGDLAYFTQDGRLVKYDISQPDNPLLLTEYDLGSPSAAMIANGLVYAINYGIFYVLDPTETGPAAQLGELTIGNPTALWIEDNLAFVANQYRELVIIDLRNPRELITSGRYRGLARVNAVEVISDTAYLANTEQGVHVINVEDPHQPTYLSTVPFRPGAYDLAMKDHYLYVTAGDTGLKVFNLATTITPTLIYTYTHMPGAFQIEIQEDIAFVTGRTLIYIFDISKPAAPVLRSTFPCSGACNIAVKLPWLYVSTERGFQIILVSEPYFPQPYGDYLIENLPSPLPATLIVYGNYLYLPVGYEPFVDIIDVNSASSPALYERVQLAAGSVLQAGPYAFLTSGEALRTVTIYDLNATARLRAKASFTLPAYPRAIEIVNNLLFVADDHAGLQILLLNPENFAPEFYLPLIIS